MTAPACDVAGLPWPEGDPDGLRAAATRANATATSLRTAGGRLTRASAHTYWTGPAADAFGLSVSRQGTEISRGAGQLTDAAGALKELAGTVERAQERVRQLAREVERAEDAARQAASRADDAQSASNNLKVRRAHASDADEAAAMGPAVSAAADRAADATAAADQARAQAAEIRARAEREARELCEEVTRADQATAGAVDAAAAAAPIGGDSPAVPSPPATPLAAEVAKRYAPQFAFDSSEDHFPMDLRRWLANADAMDGYFDPRGEDVRNGDLDTATLPFSYHVTPDGELQLEYGTYYPFNDFPDTPGPFDHEGDFEPFTIQFQDGAPSHADYESHGHTRVVPWDEVHRVEGQEHRPVVYPSHGGHGNNPAPGTWGNNFTRGVGDEALNGLQPGLGDNYRDHADGQGPRWDPSGDLVDAGSIPELGSDQRFGEDKGDGNPRSYTDPGPPQGHTEDGVEVPGPPDLDGDDDAGGAGAAPAADPILEPFDVPDGVQNGH